MTTDKQLRQRGERVFPGGMYGHMSTYRLMPEGYPQYFRKADGCRLWDVEDNEYIDYMCSYGPMLLGYNHPSIREAADRQRNQIDIGNGPAEVIVELAEKFISQVSHADWAIFAKNGNDSTTIAMMCARAKAHKSVILVAHGAYHGSQPWTNRTAPGSAQSEHDAFITYRFNDIESLEAAVQRSNGALAGIMVSAFKHDAGKPQQLTDPAFAHRVRELCDKHDAALILDDVRAGLRLSTDTSWSALGVQPDISAWGKAIANGEPLAGVLGSESYRDAMASVFVTGSFWYQAAPMAAAIKTLSIVNENEIPKMLEGLGQKLRDGLYKQAQRHGFGIVQSGPVQMPTIMFEDDKEFTRGKDFCSQLIKEGIYFHPWHNMFLSAAHTDADIDQTLDATDRVLARLS